MRSKIGTLRAATGRRLEDRILRAVPARALRFELALESLERFAGDRIVRLLDAGCGEGLFSDAVARAHPRWRVLAADANEEMLDRGRARARSAGLMNVEFLHADLTGDLGSAEYDAVAALECLVEICDDDAAIRAMAHALRPGGLFIAHVPERDWKPVLPRSERTWRHEVRHGYTEGEIVAKVEQAGLSVTAVSGTTRGTVRLAQEVRDRTKKLSLKLRMATYPAMVAAVRLERAGLTWGSERAIFLEARRL
jgi:SAM-dependent methyltransferase